MEVDYLIIGAGFSGLTIGFKLSQSGKTVLILDSDSRVGGLAADFTLSNGTQLERFYHHWFKTDSAITELVSELGLSNKVREYTSNTGMFLNKSVWKLSSPRDLLKFRALPLRDRIRMGVATLLVRRVKDWRKIEHKSIREWLEPIYGKNVYRAVWGPLVQAKFSIFAEDVSAAWMWKKLVLRGGSRSKGGTEILLYFKGGFGQLARHVSKSILTLGGDIRCEERVISLETDKNRVSKVITSKGNAYTPRCVIFTGEPSQLPNLMKKNDFSDWEAKLKSIQYLANICLVLLLDRSLSNTYWLNVNDPGFPFVGVIEHTNLVSREEYGNLHVVYLSRYIAAENGDYLLPDEKYFQNCLNAISRMFPDFHQSWVKEYYIWRAPFAQPIATKSFSKIVPDFATPYENLFLSSMAQVYPEDRGTNYAVKNGYYLAQKLIKEFR